MSNYKAMSVRTIESRDGKKIFQLLVLIILFHYVNPTFSLIQQTKQWLNLNYHHRLFDQQKWLYLLETEARTNLKPIDFEEETLRMGLGYQYTSNISFWNGYQWNSRNPFTQTNQINRLWQQLLWQIWDSETFTLTNHFLFEERSQNHQSQWNYRFRQRISLTFPKKIHSQWTPVFWNELYVNLSRPNWISTGTVSQNRSFIGFDVPILKHSRLELGYLNRYLFKTAPTPEQMDNIIFLSFIFNSPYPVMH